MKNLIPANQHIKEFSQGWSIFRLIVVVLVFGAGVAEAPGVALFLCMYCWWNGFVNGIKTEHDKPTPRANHH
tara:strand:+ start:519 stop:734 length:216 start_codon:yes stop_codon:yes gene_type:complete